MGLGLRDAWRWSFDKRNGNMWIADVGADAWEEINIKTPAQSAGLNYGWPCYEGNAIFDTTDCKDIGNYTFPTITYPHDSTGTNGGEVIIGGYVYRGSAYPALYGYYVCADYIVGNAWVIKRNRSGGFNVNQQTGFPIGLVGFGEGEDGELYVASLSDGTVYRVQATATPASIAAETIPSNISSQRNLKSYIYPTLVNNNIINIELKEPYKFIRLLDIAGHELMHKTLDNQSGRITLNLPKLESGMYIVQLVGASTLQQKIYVSR